VSVGSAQGIQPALLAHLRDRFSVAPENLATEALAFLLNTYPEAGGAFLAHCRTYQRALPTVERFRTQDWLAEDEAIPDLVGDHGSASPLMVEVKFQAALTAHQPTTYLKRLEAPGAPGALLLFLVPRSRVPHLWDQLKARCLREQMAVEEEDPVLPAASVGGVRLGVTSWSAVLDVLAAALRATSDPRAFWELEQLRGLCEYEDREVFEPLTTGDFDRRIPRRILQYRDLIYEAVERMLPAHGLAETDGLLRTASGDLLGRYFRLCGWECALTLNWRLWATHEHQGPLWLWMSDRRIRGHAGVLAAFATLRERGVSVDEDTRRVCIELPLGCERDEILEAIRHQVAALAELLPQRPEADPAPDGASTDGVI